MYCLYLLFEKSQISSVCQLDKARDKTPNTAFINQKRAAKVLSQHYFNQR